MIRARIISTDNRHVPLPYAALIFATLTFSAPDASALTPQEIYRQAERQVFVLESLNDKGEVVSFHSAVLVDTDTVASQCDSLQGAASIRLRQGLAVYPAHAAAKDDARNLCLLKAPGTGSFAVKVANDTTEPGAKAYAVGNALGLGISIAEGVVSGIRTSHNESYIQFTAAIAPGSEGGGLFDADGRLIGLISYRQRDGQNVNFAFPARWLKEISSRAASTGAAEMWRAKASSLEQQAKWDELATHAEAWSAALPDSAEAWLWLGSAQVHRQDWAAAEHAYRLALHYEPSATEAGVALTRVLLMQNKAQPALEVARAMLAYRMEDAHIWLAVGLAERALGHADEAKQAFAQTTKLEPWNGEAYAALVDIARLRGNWAEALSVQRQWVQVDSENPAIWSGLAGLYARTGRPERALASAERAIALAGSNSDAWLVKGIALHGLKRDHEAIDALRKGIALQTAPKAEPWGWLGDLYYQLNMLPDSLAAFREALRLAPGDAPLQARYGTALLDDLQFAEALKLFQGLRDEHPDDAYVWRQIGSVYLSMARPEDAIPAFEKSLSLNRNQPPVWFTLMYTYHLAGRRDDAKRAYQSLSTVDTAMAERAYRMLILPYGATP